MKPNSPKIVLSAFLIGIVLAISPLALHTIKIVPNNATYFTSTMVYENFAGVTEYRAFRPPVSSKGSVELLTNLTGEGYDYYVVGSDESNHSMATWNIFTWNFPLLKEESAGMRSYLLIDGLVPTVQAQFVSAEVDHVSWRDDNFTDGWSLRTWSESWTANISAYDGYITFTGNLTSQRDYYRLSKDLPAKFSTNNHSYLIASFNSPDALAYIGAWDGEVLVKGRNALYSGGKWVTVFLKLPEYKNISRVEIGFDDSPFRHTSGASGEQSVSFDFIMIASARVIGPHVKILLNDYLVRDMELSVLAPIKDQHWPRNIVYTVNASNYVDAIHSFRVWSAKTFLVPVDENLLKGEDYVKVVVEGYGSWILSSISIKHEVYYDSPFWLQFIPYIYSAFGAELFVTFMMLRRLYKWFKNM